MIADLLAGLQPLLFPAIGAILGGVGLYFLLDLGFRQRRARHRIAEALAAELVNIADKIAPLLADENLDEIPAYYRTSHVVFDSIVDRLGELPFEDVLNTTKIYEGLEELNRMPAAWRERAANAYSFPLNHPLREEELKTIEEGRQGFYKILGTMHRDCKSLAVYLRTKYVLGWRGLIPHRWRPQKNLKR